MPKRVQIEGQKFNRLTAIKFVKMDLYKSVWLFRCICGTEKILRAKDVMSGNTKSCGCALDDALKKITLNAIPHLKHIRAIHNAMLGRCNDKKHKCYKNYGARGIKVDDIWLDFKQFYDWYMKDGYQKGLEVDRIDNNGNYNPNNCRLVSRSKNQNNTRRTVKYEYKGNRITIRDFCEIHGLDYEYVWSRMRINCNKKRRIDFNEFCLKYNVEEKPHD